MELRRIVAEAGLDFDALQAAFKAGELSNQLKTVEGEPEDIEELIILVVKHFGDVKAAGEQKGSGLPTCQE